MFCNWWTLESHLFRKTRKTAYNKSELLEPLLNLQLNFGSEVTVWNIVFLTIVEYQIKYAFLLSMVEHSEKISRGLQYIQDL